jgi:hypothetical protein
LVNTGASLDVLARSVPSFTNPSSIVIDLLDQQDLFTVWDLHCTQTIPGCQGFFRKFFGSGVFGFQRSALLLDPAAFSGNGLDYTPILLSVKGFADQFP